MQNEIYDKKNGITYMLCGDYYLPELTLADTEPTYHEAPEIQVPVRRRPEERL